MECFFERSLSIDEPPFRLFFNYVTEFRTLPKNAGVLYIAIIGIIFFTIAGMLYFIFSKQNKEQKPTEVSYQITQIPTSLSSLSPTPSTIYPSDNDTDLQILEELPKVFPQAKWHDIKQSTSYLPGKEDPLTGRSRSAIYVTNSFPGSYEDTNLLTQLAWRRGKMEADSPQGNAWDYVKNLKDKQRELIYSFNNRSLQPKSGGGVEAVCPCTYDIEVFLSDPY